MKNDMAQYPELVYYRRVVKKIPASEMAKEIGVSKETYLRTERGEREFTLSQAIKIANKLNMPVWSLFPKIFDPSVARHATNETKEGTL